MQDNRLWFLIARQLSGEISTPEFEELQFITCRNIPTSINTFVDTLYSYFDLHTVSDK